MVREAKNKKRKIVLFKQKDFIPFAAYYAPETIITKNGELLQTIKIDINDFRPLNNEGLELRDVIRDTIFRALPDNSYSFWFNTLRRNKSFSLPESGNSKFSQMVDRQWSNTNNYERQFANEFYVTIIKEGQSPKIGGAKGFLRGLLPPAERKFRFSYLEEAAQELAEVSDQFMKNLQVFGARKLGISKHDGVYYSDHMQFFSKLINHDDQLFEMIDSDLSDALINKEYTLGFNTMVIEDNVDENSKFSAMLTIKNHLEIPSRVLDMFLQLPLEFTLTQTYDFIPRDLAFAPFKPIIKATNLSGDKTMVKFAGVEDIYNSDSESPLDFGEQQLMLMASGVDEKELSHNIERIVGTLSELGLVAVREDLGLENAFWGQLPANFSFLRRLNTINTAATACFASVQSSPAGKKSGHWGSATSIIPSAQGTPYFFDFFSEGTGNTIIVGDDLVEVNAVSSFLLCQSLRNNPSVVVINTDRGNEGLIRAIGGKYFQLGDQSGEKLTINPFSLPRNHVNLNFQIFWLSALLSLSKHQVTRETQVLLKNCIEASFTAKPTDHVTPIDISTKLEASGAIDAAHFIRSWWNNFPLAGNQTSEAIMEFTKYRGFDVSTFAGKPLIADPLLLFLMHAVNLSLDGNPAIVSLNNASDILFEPTISAITLPWLDSLKNRNAMVMLSFVNPSVTPDISIMRDVTAKTATRIFLHNSFPDENFADNFGLESEELELIQRLEPLRGEVYLKQGSINLALLLHLGNMRDVKSILASEISSLNMIEKFIEKAGENPEKWLPLYMKELAKVDERLF